MDQWVLGCVREVSERPAPLSRRRRVSTVTRLKAHHLSRRDPSTKAKAERGSWGVPPRERQTEGRWSRWQSTATTPLLKCCLRFPRVGTAAPGTTRSAFLMMRALVTEVPHRRGLQRLCQGCRSSNSEASASRTRIVRKMTAMAPTLMLRRVAMALTAGTTVRQRATAAPSQHAVVRAHATERLRGRAPVTLAARIQMMYYPTGSS